MCFRSIFKILKTTQQAKLNTLIQSFIRLVTKYGIGKIVQSEGGEYATLNLNRPNKELQWRDRKLNLEIYGVTAAGC